MDLRELEAFVAVVEEQGMSAASQRLHVSQSALSQTISALERELGVKLLVRSSVGESPTAAGEALVGEARAVLARHSQALRMMADYCTEGSGVVRLGIPLELPPAVLPEALSRFAADCPDARIVPKHLSTAAQFAGLRNDELDVGLVRERPVGPEFDAMLVIRERLGVLISAEVADRLRGPHGLALDALGGMDWLGFARSGSPAWHDELTAVLRGHGIDVRASAEHDQPSIPTVQLAGVSAGRAFALAPPGWPYPLSDGVTWLPLVGHPLIRRTWVVWPADSRRRDIGHLVATFEVADM